MKVVICYDVSTQDPPGRKRLRKIAEACKDHGVRVQYSVFECEISPAQWVILKHQLLDLMDERTDSLRFYYINTQAAEKTEHHGVRAPLDLSGPLLF